MSATVIPTVMMAVEYEGIRVAFEADAFTRSKVAYLRVEVSRQDAMGSRCWVPVTNEEDRILRLEYVLVHLARGEAKVYRSDDPKPARER